MSVAQFYDTVPAFPLGQPHDGRPRYGMTPDMAKLYRWLVANRPHGEPFKFDFRDAAGSVPMHLQSLHANVVGLVERGWLSVSTESNHHARRYSLVPPVMHFSGCAHG